jgi:phosphoglycolate phosphatase-like HAD superfamily hydrolase
MIEVIHDHTPRGHIRFAVFDMDGTLSLIREGWPEVMAEAMMNELRKTPECEDESALRQFVAELIAQTTGQTTSYQMACLGNEVRKRGGQPEASLIYKNRYLAQLGERIDRRIAALRAGQIDPDEMMVPGSREILQAMCAHNVRCYLVSGTYEPYVLNEAEALQITSYFEGIYGGQDDPTRFSKRQFMQNLREGYLLDGHEVVSLGDGITEIKEAKNANAIAVGVASRESTRTGIDEMKRQRLIQAGADVIVPDFREHRELVTYLFDE